MENPTDSKRNLSENSQNVNVNAFRGALLGLTALNQDTVLLDYGNVIIRRGYKDLKTVRLLSGGLAGPDLSQALFVGKGMLTASILGEDVAPNSRQILRTIKELHQGENCGILVIARGGPEMFSFGLAVERASADCQMRVKLLSFNDNNCGFVMLTKILGAMAEQGAVFGEIYRCYNDIINEITSVQLNYTPSQKDDESVSLSTNADQTLTRTFAKTSEADLRLHHSIPTVVLINVSKTLTTIAELCLVKQVIERLRQLGVAIVRIYSGNFVSGPPDSASLTVLKVHDSKIVAYLDSPCTAPGWRHFSQFLPEVTLKNDVVGLLTKQGKESVPPKGPTLSEQQSTTLVKAVQFACEALISCERQLNIIDAEKSAGNAGARLRKLAEHLNKRLSDKRMPIDCPYAFFKKLSVMAESALGGTMGSVYGIVFESAANVFGTAPDDEPITPELWTKALAAAEEAIGRYNSEDAAAKTMYLPIKACKTAVDEHKSLDFIERFGFGVSQAEEAAQKTRRSTQKYADAGAHAVGIWIRAVYEGVKVMCLGEIVSEKLPMK